MNFNFSKDLVVYFSKDLLPISFCNVSASCDTTDSAPVLEKAPDGATHALVVNQRDCSLYVDMKLCKTKKIQVPTLNALLLAPSLLQRKYYDKYMDEFHDSNYENLIFLMIDKIKKEWPQQSTSNKIATAN